jgi:hypothetical protein
MNLTEIASRLREVAASIESVATKSDEDDFEFPNDMVIPFITNASLTCAWLKRSSAEGKSLRFSPGLSLFQSSYARVHTFRAY